MVVWNGINVARIYIFRDHAHNRILGLQPLGHWLDVCFNGHVLIEPAPSVGTSGCPRVEFPPRRLFLRLCTCSLSAVDVPDNERTDQPDVGFKSV